jgi:6,7-dimethyl-8-ribityllumazine synthase
MQGIPKLLMFIKIFRLQSVQIIIDAPTPTYELPLFSKALAAYTKYDGIISIEFLISLLLRDTDSGDTVKNNNQINEIF